MKPETYARYDFKLTYLDGTVEFDYVLTNDGKDRAFQIVELSNTEGVTSFTIELLSESQVDLFGYPTRCTPVVLEDINDGHEDTVYGTTE
jgi:hypothetical protein